MLGWIRPKCSCRQLWQPDKDVLFVRIILWKISVTEREGTWQVVSKEQTRDPWLNVRFLPIKTHRADFWRRKKGGGGVTSDFFWCSFEMRSLSISPSACPPRPPSDLSFSHHLCRFTHFVWCCELYKDHKQEWWSADEWQPQRSSESNLDIEPFVSRSNFSLFYFSSQFIFFLDPKKVLEVNLRLYATHTSGWWCVS